MRKLRVLNKHKKTGSKGVAQATLAQSQHIQTTRQARFLQASGDKLYICIFGKAFKDSKVSRGGYGWMEFHCQLARESKQEKGQVEAR
jgi:hypothetical protein